MPAGLGARRMCAVIADDHGLYRAGLTEVLRDEFRFHDVKGVSSLDEALAEIDGLPQVDLALFDLSMPGMSGPASLAQLRQMYPHLTIAVISASEERARVIETMAVGLNGFIPKSLPNDDLIAAIHTILNGNIFVPRMIVEMSASSKPHAAQNRAALQQSSWTEGCPQPVHITPRQRDVLEFVRKGLTNKEIARRLDITEGTVKIHVACLLTSFSVRNRTALAMLQ